MHHEINILVGIYHVHIYTDYIVHISYSVVWYFHIIQYTHTVLILYAV